jgi:hypothetical protein
VNVRAAVVLLLALPSVVLCTCTTASAAALPPQLVAKLEADRDRANATLDQARKLLATAATHQREAAAANARTTDQVDVLEAVVGLVGMDLPTTVSQDADERLRATGTGLEKADAALTDATDDASEAQAVALDSDRRLRALQRASATEDERDTTLGSWRFGSGGPAVSAETIDRYLQSKGSPLAGQGAAFLEAGVEHELDPRLVVAIAGAESYFGIQTCAPHNAWGWGCPSSPFEFKDWAHAIDTVTLGLRENYVDDGLTSVGEIHLRYAPPNAANDPNDLNYAWADNVARFLVEQGGDPEDVEGVLGPSR